MEGSPEETTPSVMALFIVSVFPDSSHIAQAGLELPL